MLEKSLGENRRTSKRHPVDLVVKTRAVSGDAAGPDANAPVTTYKMSNLSLGGAYIDGLPLVMGQRVAVEFIVPSQPEAIESVTTVRFTTPNGIGVQFDGLRARDVWALNKFFEQLALEDSLVEI